MAPISRKRDEGERRRKSTSHMLHSDLSQEPTKYAKKKTKGIELNKIFYLITIPLAVVLVGSLIGFVVTGRLTSPVITSFSASPQIIDKGELTTLAWNVSNATSVDIQPGIGIVALTGSKLVSPPQDVTFILTATNKSDSVRATSHVFVSGQEPQPTTVIIPEPGTGTGTEPEAGTETRNETETVPVRVPISLPEIDYQRAGGIAGFNDHLVIYSDGHCRLQRQSITKNFYLTPGDLAQLRQLFQQANFFNLNSEYLPANVCCDRFDYIVTYRNKGRAHTVHTMSGTVPAALAPVLSQLNQIIGDNST